MNKQVKQIIAMAALLIALFIIFVAVKKSNTERDREIYIPQKESIYTYDLNTITEYSYQYNGEVISLKYQDGKWVLVGDDTREVKQYIANTQRSLFSDVKITSVIDGVEDLSDYGLAEPKVTIRFKVGDTERVLKVGDFNPTSEIFYMCIPEEPDKVYVSDSYLYDNFTKPLSEISTAAKTE